MSLPQTMKAYKCTGPDQAELKTDVPLPKLRDDYILIKVHAVALNPTDWKHIAGIPTPGCTVGCDVTGTILQIGPSVTKSWSKGDHIAAFTHGVNAVEPEDGAFGEYAVVKGDIAIKIPDSLAFEEAATLGVGTITVGQGLYQTLKLPLPTEPTETKTKVLVYGGSTATGLWALQYAKLSGCTVYTTCSPRNFELCKQYGADEVFDYSDPDVGAKIREATGDALGVAFDCISDHKLKTPEICAAALASDASKVEGGVLRYSSLLPAKLPRDDAEQGYTLGYTANGERFTFRAGMEYPAKPDHFEFAKMFVEVTEKLLAGGKVRAPPMLLRNGGLDGVKEGLSDLRSGKVSGEKIVLKVVEIA